MTVRNILIVLLALIFLGTTGIGIQVPIVQAVLPRFSGILFALGFIIGLSVIRQGPLNGAMHMACLPWRTKLRLGSRIWGLRGP